MIGNQYSDIRHKNFIQHKIGSYVEDILAMEQWPMVATQKHWSMINMIIQKCHLYN